VRLSRRHVLVAAAVGALAACSSPQTEPISIAAGEQGGFYLEFAQLLATALRGRGIDARADVTKGSVENLKRLATDQATLGLSLADAALTAYSTGTDLRALGRVYENYMQLVVRAEDPITNLADLTGRPVSLGAPGSGAAQFGERLFATSGIQVQAGLRPLAAAVVALEQNDTDALLWSGGVPTPALAALAGRRPIRLIPLDDELSRLRAGLGGVYGRVSIPAGIYGAPMATATVGVANLLVCRPSLPDDLATQIVRTLVTAASRLVPASALGAQFLDQRSLIDTGQIPLHPGAAAAYRELHG
jgi:uncharacterized protein